MKDKQMTTLSKKNISINLYKLRNSNNITVEKFAEALDVSTRIVYDWESGKKYPSIDNLINIVVYYGVGMDSILQEL